jgi:hypothetical protein
MVRAMATVPKSFFRPLSASFSIGSWVGFLLHVGIEAAALNHEVIDYTMERSCRRSNPSRAYIRKFATDAGCILGIEFEFDGAVSRIEGNHRDSLRWRRVLGACLLFRLFLSRSLLRLLSRLLCRLRGRPRVTAPAGAHGTCFALQGIYYAASFAGALRDHRLRHRISDQQQVEVPMAQWGRGAHKPPGPT